MYEQKAFILNNRLKTCALMVQTGAKLADIGTDHAYLPVWLAKNNMIKHAIAADIKKGPLEMAKRNIEKYSLEDKVETRLSDGLEKINENEVDNIVIAGMGGELIASIISKAPWLKNSSKNLVLQPMSMAKELRNFLRNENFEIKEEIAVIDSKRAYTVMRAMYTENNILCDDLYPYVGKLQYPFSDEAKSYLKREINNIHNKIKGYKITKNYDKTNELNNIVLKIEDLLK